MSTSSVVFGERVVLLDGAPTTLPLRVLLPGPGDTVADRAERAVDPVAEARRVKAAAEFGVSLYVQSEVDIPAADRLCPPTSSDYRQAQAVLDLGAWRYRLDHCPPGPRLAALLDQRPTDAAPSPGAGTVAGGTIRLRTRGSVATSTVSRGGDGATGSHPVPGTGRKQRAGDEVSATAPGADGSLPSGADGADGAERVVRVIATDPALAPRPLDSDVWPQTIVATIEARQRLISHLQARQYADIADLSASYRDIQQFLTSELGLALTLTDGEAAAMLATAEALRDRLPGTAAALEEGRIDDAKATAIVHATTSCTAEVAELVEKSVLPDAERITATAVRRRARRAVIAADPDGAADRHRRAVSERHVWRAPDEDGMARLGIYASAQDIDTIWRAITAVADAIKRPGDTRSLGERRADAMLMICSDIVGAGGWEGLRLPDKGFARPRVNVTVPFTVLLGHRAPCELAGHGPISTEQALSLIGGGDLYRMICDPESGALLDYGRTRYRPPPHLAEFVRLRDGECPLPTCHQSAERGQIDHIVPAKPDPITGRPTHGTTSAENLAPPCPHHHLGKDAGRGFHLHRARDGTYTWITPLGFVYTWRPDPLWHADTDTIPGSALPVTLRCADRQSVDVTAAAAGSGGRASGEEASHGVASGDADLADAAPTDAVPVDADLADAAPTDAVPVDAAPTDIARADTAPADTLSVDRPARSVDTVHGAGSRASTATGPVAGGRVDALDADTDAGDDDGAKSGVPVCGCPGTCPCQQPPPVPWFDTLEPLIVDRDWADGCLTTTPAAMQAALPESTASADPAASSPPVPAPAVASADDPPPF